MAVLRFQTSTWSDGVYINGEGRGTGWVTVESDGAVSCKNLFTTTFLFDLEDVEFYEVQKKHMELKTSDGRDIKIKAKRKHLDDLGTHIHRAKKKAAS